MRPRPFWLPEALCLVLCAGCATLLFALTDWDLRVERLFYHPDRPGDPWPAAAAPFWRALYYATPWLAAAFGVTGIALLAAGGLSTRRRAWRTHGLFLVLCLALGPGLVVNAALKDNWGRARPRQVETLGGYLQYQPPLRPGPVGKSFPCGHSSVAFVYGAFYYLLRKRHPRAAIAARLGSAVAGGIVGLGRMAAGAHFPSDVIWSGILTHGTILLVHHGLLRIPRAEKEGGRFAAPLIARLPRPAGLLGSGALGVVLLAAVLLATPYEQSLSRTFAPAIPAGSIRELDLQIEEGNVRIVLTRAPGGLLRSSARFKGFGFPGARVREDLRPPGEERGGALYRILREGMFSDLEGDVLLRVDAAAVDRIMVRVPRGLLTLESEVPSEAIPLIHCRDRRTAVRIGRGFPRGRITLGPPDPVRMENHRATP